MHPLLIVAIPLLLIVVGMVLNGIGLSFDQPPSSPEQDPARRLAAEREAYRQLFDRQRSRAMKRQKRVGQYGWLLMIATIGAFIWFYMDTVQKTTLSSRLASLETLGTEEGKNMVLALTLIDGSNVKYIIKIPNPARLTDAAKQPVTKDTISAWELEKLGTALSIGSTALPVGIALKIGN